MQLQRPVLAVQYLQPRAQSLQEVQVCAGGATCTSSEIARPTAGLCWIPAASVTRAAALEAQREVPTVSAEAAGEQHVAHVRVLPDDAVLVDGIVFVETGPRPLGFDRLKVLNSACKPLP